MNNLFYQYSNSTIDPELLFYLLSDKLEVIEEHPLIATSYYGYFLQLHQ